MNKYLKIVKLIVLSLASVAVFSFSQGVARADEVTVGGRTAGCFGTPGAPCAPSVPSVGPGQTASLMGLRYQGSSFEVTTVNGLAPVGNAANPPNNFNNFGSFTLDSTANDYNGNTFTLRIAFSLPLGTAPGSGLYTADLLGSVTSTNNGGVQITFLNATQGFFFSNGQFSVRINDLAITGGQGPVPLTGTIQTAPVPEPTTLLLLGTGLAGLAARFRKRKKSKL